MSNRIIYLERRGLRGESYADILRRTGLFGVTPTDSDEEAIGKINADAQFSADIALASTNYFATASAGEAATAVGELFSYPDNGVLVLAQRTAGGHDVLENSATLRADLAADTGSASIGTTRGRLDHVVNGMPLYASTFLESATVPGAAGFQSFVDQCAAEGRQGIWDYSYAELATTVTLPANLNLAVRAGAEIRWTGGVSYPGVGYVMDCLGSNITLACEGQGEWRVTSGPQDDLRWAIRARGKRDDITVRGLRTWNMCQFHAATDAASYADVVPGVNSPTGITVTGGGADFETQGHGSGSVWLEYVVRGRISDMTMSKVPMGVQSWGGNAHPAADGAKANERKCRDIEVRNVVVDGAGACWVFFCMTEDASAWNCSGYDALDVGFDTEGGDGEFHNCRGYRASNGVFSTFFFCGRVVWNNIVAHQDDPTLRLTLVSNIAQTIENDTLIINNPIFSAGQGAMPGVAAFPPTTRRIIMNNPVGYNVKLEITGNNNNQVEINDPSLEFPYSASEAFNAIEMAQVHGPGARGIIRGGSIRSLVVQPAGCTGIRMTRQAQDDVRYEVSGGTDIVGFTNSVILENDEGTGVGRLYGKVFDVTSAAAPVGVNLQAATGTFVFNRNYNLGGVLHS